MPLDPTIIAAIAAAGVATLILVTCIVLYFIRRRRRLDLENRHRSSYLGFTRRTAHVDRGLAVRGYAKGIKEGSPNTLLQGFLVAPNQIENKQGAEMPPVQRGTTDIQSEGAYHNSPLTASIQRQKQQAAAQAPVDPEMIIAPIQPPLFDLGSLGFDFQKKDKLASLENSSDREVLGSPRVDSTPSPASEGHEKPSRFAHLLNFVSASSSMEEINWKSRPSKPIISEKSKDRPVQKKSDNVAKRMLMKVQSTFSPPGPSQQDELDGRHEGTASEVEDKSMMFRKKSRRWKEDESPIDPEAVQSHFDQYVEEEGVNTGEGLDALSSPGMSYSDTEEDTNENGNAEAGRSKRGSLLRGAVTEASKPVSVMDLLAGQDSDTEKKENPNIRDSPKRCDSPLLQSPQRSTPPPVSVTSSPLVAPGPESSRALIGPGSPVSPRPETHRRTESATSPMASQSLSPRPIRPESPNTNPPPPLSPSPADKLQLGQFERRQAVRVRSTNTQSYMHPVGSSDDSGALGVSGRARNRPNRRATVATLHIDAAELEGVRLGSMDQLRAEDK